MDMEHKIYCKKGRNLPKSSISQRQLIGHHVQTNLHRGLQVKHEGDVLQARRRDPEGGKALCVLPVPVYHVPHREEEGVCISCKKIKYTYNSCFLFALQICLLPDDPSLVKHCTVATVMC